MPRIVDDALFYAAQEKLDRQHPLKTPPRLVRSSVLLTALAKCGLCGAPMRKQSGKFGKYHYYRCSKKCDAGTTACKGVSIAMGELDGIVLDALEETVLEPKRLRKMTQSLAARAHEKNSAITGRLKDMDGEKRKVKKRLTELYRLIGDGEIEADPTLTQHLKDLQETHASLVRRIAHLEQERNLPVEIVTRATAEKFGAAVKSALRNNQNREFAKAYIQAIVSEVTVTDDEIRIKGPNAALTQQTAAFAAKGDLVPSFAQQWRRERDSNPRYP